MLDKRYAATRAKSILVLGSFSPSLVNFRGHLLEAMVNQGLVVHAAAPGMAQDLETQTRLDEIRVAPHDVRMRRTGLNPLADLATLFRLVALFRKVRPDIVLTYTVKPVIWGSLAAATARVPRRFALITGLGYSFAQGNGWTQRLVGWAVRRLYRVSLHFTTGVIFQNDDDRALFSAIGLVPESRPVAVVAGSGVDLAWFAQAPLPAEKPLSFLMIARLLRAKGVREFSAAAELVRARHPETRFCLVGPLENGPDALSQADVDQLASRGVEWRREASDVRPYIENCHVYVLPSYREGTPRTVLEAMAIGRAIITTDVPGCRQTVVEGENGFLVAPRSSDALAAAMMRFIERPDLIPLMGLASRRLVEKRFDVHAINQAMMQHMAI